MLTEIQLAEGIARWLHRNQRDKIGMPYIHHVMRVADVVSEPSKAAAWLHDTLEDCNITVVDLLNAGISRRTVSTVLILSKLNPNESYEQFIVAIKLSGNESALEIKKADVADNIDRVDELLSAEDRERLRKKYHMAQRMLGSL